MVVVYTAYISEDLEDWIGWFVFCTPCLFQPVQRRHLPGVDLAGVYPQFSGFRAPASPAGTVFPVCNMAWRAFDSAFYLPGLSL